MSAPAKIQPMRPRDHSETVREILDGYAQATPAERPRLLRELAIGNAAFADGFRAGLLAAGAAS